MNAQEFGLKQGQDLFEGCYHVEMSRLRQAGYTPWSTEDIMDARNAVSAEHSFWNNYINTDFGIAGTRDKIYLAPHSARLRAITAETDLTNGGFALGENDTQTMRAYDRKDHILGRDLTEQEARDSQVWLDFAGGDKTRLDKYVENTFRFGKKNWNYNRMMGVFVPTEIKPIERAVVLNRLYGWSRAGGDDRLFSYTRFVGVRRSGASQAAPQARAEKSSPYRTDPRSDLEIFLSEHDISREDLPKAVELYRTVKQLKL